MQLTQDLSVPGCSVLSWSRFLPTNSFAAFVRRSFRRGGPFLRYMASRRRSRDYDDAKPAKLDKATLGKFLRIFRYLTPYRWPFAVGMLLLLVNSVLSLAFPGLLGKLVDAAPTTAPLTLGEGSGVRALDLTNIDTVALLLLAVLMVVLFWNDHRLEVLAISSGVFASLGVVAALLLRGKIKSGSTLFSVSLAELAKDNQALRGTHE